MTTTLDAALEYLERGWSVIPIWKGKKNPSIEGWKEYQTRLPTEDEVIAWFDGTNHDIAVICGSVSNLAVVDTDNEEATKFAAEQGWDRSPYRVKTRKGFHYYFSTSEVVKKGKIAEGIDLQAEGAYVLAPPSTDKEFAPLSGCDPDDLPVYLGPHGGNFSAKVVPINTHESYAEINLDNIVIKESVWTETDRWVKKNGKMICGAGHGCREKLFRLAGELVIKEEVDDAFDLIQKWMDQYMRNPFDEGVVWEAINFALSKEVAKEKIERVEPEPEPQALTFNPITVSRLEELETKIGEQRFFVDPIIPSNDASLTMIFGYSGHGKSMFTRNMLYASCVGRMNYGPFILTNRPRVLYLDLENGRKNIAKFLRQARATYGHAGDRFMMFAPFEHGDMNLRTEAGLKLLEQTIKQTRANIVCIDTVRTAFPGMNESEGKEWAGINMLILRLRNAGISCVLVHHANKPQGDGASGSYAGSTNALTNLEFGIKITQIFDEADRARAKAGLYTGDIESPLLERLGSPALLKDGERLAVKMEVRFVKNREADESLEDLSYIGFANSYDSGTFRPVFSPSAKQRAIVLSRPHMNRDGVIMPPLSDIEIAHKLGIHVRVVSEWLATIRDENIASHIANSQ